LCGDRGLPVGNEERAAGEEKLVLVGNGINDGSGHTGNMAETVIQHLQPAQTTQHIILYYYTVYYIIILLYSVIYYYITIQCIILLYYYTV